jgi:hypothetical protein
MLVGKYLQVGQGASSVTDGRVNLPLGTTIADGISFGAESGIYRSASNVVTHSATTSAFTDISGRNLGLGTAPASTARILFPVGSTSADGILFGDITMYRVGGGSLALNSSGVNDVVLRVRQLANPTTNNGALSFENTGVLVYSNKANSDTVFNVTNSHASSTGPIQTWSNSAGVVGSVTQTGFLRFNNHQAYNSANTYNIYHFENITTGAAFVPNNTTNLTSGSRITVSLGDTFAPTSGTATLALLSIVGSVNQTGGASGATRGLYINTTLTAANSWRAIEINTASGWAMFQSQASANNYFEGNVGLKTNAPSSVLSIGGNTSNITGQQVASIYSPTAITGNYSAFNSQVLATPSASSSAVIKSYTAETGVANGNAFDLTATAVGLNSYFGKITHRGTGVVTGYAGFYVDIPIFTSSGTITNSYGLYIAGQKVTGVTNGFGVYQTGASDLNYFAGNVGIGVSSPGSLLIIGGTPTNINGQSLGMQYSPNFTSNTYAAINLQIVASPSANTSGSTTAYTTETGTQTSNAFDFTAAIGLRSFNSNVNHRGTGVITGLAHFIANAPTFGSSGTITNAYGLYITGQKVTGVTNGYGVYQVGATDSNYFAGSISMGTTSTPAKLTIISTTEQLRIGYDVSNYLSITTNSTGSITFDLTGTTPTFTFVESANFSANINLSSGAVNGNLYQNYTSSANSRIQLTTTGAVIDRNLGNADTLLKLNLIHASATGKILDLQFGGVSKAYFDKDGYLTVPQLTVGTVTNTEIGYLDGVTGAIQTQIDGKQPSLSGTGFVKISGSTISYDNSTYLTTSAATAGYQPLDSDLTTIAGLTATTNNFIVSVSSAWASRTPAQVKTTLSLDQVDNTTDLGKPLSTATIAALSDKAS